MNPNYGWGLPVQASSYARSIDNSLHILHLAMALIFALWAVYMAYCLIRYRWKSGAGADYTHKNELASYTPDVVILVFEIWLIFIIGVPIWAHIKEDLPKPEDAVVINVAGEQFSWTAHYPGSDGKFGKTLPNLAQADNPVGPDQLNRQGRDPQLFHSRIQDQAGRGPRHEDPHLGPADPEGAVRTGLRPAVRDRPLPDEGRRFRKIAGRI